jgi:hypothetical protein
MLIVSVKRISNFELKISKDTTEESKSLSERKAEPESN